MGTRVSTRISLRWLPDPPSEPTDTLVFSLGGFFMDLRVLKADNSIDWALAGERQVISTSPMKCRWIKTLDSLGLTEPDEGSFTKLPNGDDFETGAMPCPERGMVITQYEEIWRQRSPISGGKYAWILESVDHGDRKTFLGRVGGEYMALTEKKWSGFGARSDIWDEHAARWKQKYVIGDINEIPSMERLSAGEVDGEALWKVGDLIVVIGKEYLVRAVELLK